MTQEEKELLLKDLCGRLLYGVKCKILDTNEVKTLGSIQYDGENTLFDFWNDNKKQYEYQLYLSEFKPCLLPISNMTDEQKNECFKGTPLEIDKYGDIAVKDDFYGGSQYTDLEIYLKVINWLLKNHFDIYGLIPMDLANDATGLNIY